MRSATFPKLPPLVPPPRRPHRSGIEPVFSDEETPTQPMPRLRAIVPSRPAHFCPRCGGSGKVHNNPYEQAICNICDGRGRVDHAVFARYVVEHEKAHPNSRRFQGLKK